MDKEQEYCITDIEKALMEYAQSFSQGIIDDFEGNGGIVPFVVTQAHQILRIFAQYEIHRLPEVLRILSAIRDDHELAFYSHAKYRKPGIIASPAKFSISASPKGDNPLLGNTTEYYGYWPRLKKPYNIIGEN